MRKLLKFDANHSKRKDLIPATTCQIRMVLDGKALGYSPPHRLAETDRADLKLFWLFGNSRGKIVNQKQLLALFMLRCNMLRFNKILARSVVIKYKYI
jgi:hypothetical protein